MNIAIIAAMDIELETILAFSNLEREIQYLGRTVSIASYKGHHLYMGVCGVGKVNAASFAQYLLQEFPIDLIINSGVAGSISEELGMLSLVVGDKIVYHDFPEEILADTYPYQTVFHCNEKYISLIQEHLPKEIDLHVGIIATGDDFIDSEEKKEKVKQRADALACDMESVAVAQLAYMHKVDCLIFRAISDTADESYTGKYEDFKVDAAKIASTLVQSLLDVV